MRIPCPQCGERDVAEFRYGGDASKPRPAHGQGNLKTWHDYHFMFENPKGPHEEYWQHTLGCRQWFKLTRNTATNQILPSPLAGEGGALAPDEGAAKSRARTTNPSSAQLGTFSRKARGGGKKT